MPGLRRRTRLCAFAAVALVLFSATTAAGLYTTTASTSGLLSTGSLDAPTGLSASGTAVVTLSWTATTSTFATGTRVLRSTTPGGPYAPIAEITPRTTTTYQDGTVFGGPTYYYVVQAYYRSWTSPQSDPASVAVELYRQRATACQASALETKTTALFPDDPTAGNLLVAVGATYASSVLTMTPDWTPVFLNLSLGSPQQAIFYKVATGAADKTVDVYHVGTSGAAGLQVYEFTGVPDLPIGIPGSSSGTGTAVSSGSITVALPHTLVLAAVAHRTTSTTPFNNWTPGFAVSSFHCDVALSSNDATFGVAWKSTLAAGTYVVEAGAPASGDWVGQVVAFGPIS